jgi:hypothetical protein
MVAQPATTIFQLRPTRKLLLGKSFSVKEDLKLSFIDPADNLIHIRIRQGPDVAFRRGIF